jgi:hypothetical protein
MQVFGYIGRIAIWPRSTTEKLLNDPRRLQMGTIAWLLLSCLYGMVAYVGGLNGLGAVTPPFLPIPAAQYYLWMGPLTPIIYLVVYVLLAGMIELGSKLVGGIGNFEDTFSVVALGHCLPIFLTMWLFEMPVLVFWPGWRRSALGGLGYMPEWLDSGRQVVGVLWVVIILILAVGRVQRISLWKSGGLVLAAMIPTVIVMLTYIR